MLWIFLILGLAFHNRITSVGEFRAKCIVELVSLITYLFEIVTRMLQNLTNVFETIQILF